MGATWWQGSYGVPPPPTQVSTHLAHRKLRNQKLSAVADRGATWWQDSYGVSPTPTQVPTQLAHRRLRNREIAPFTLLECPLVADTGATWWQGSYCLSPPPTKVSTQLAHVQLRNSTFLPSRSAPWWPIWVPPGGKVAMACTHHPPEFQPNWPTED